MITRDNILSLNFIKKEDFTGSHQGMRFLMRHEIVDEEKKLSVFLWSEPLGFDATPDDQKIKEMFEFSAEGIDKAIEWMNEKYEIIKNKQPT